MTPASRTDTGGGATDASDLGDPAMDPAFAGNFSEVWAGHIQANDKKPLPKLRTPAHPHTVLVRQTVDAMKRLPGKTLVRKRPVGRFIVADGAGNPRKIPGGKWQYVRVSVAGDADVEVLWTPPGHARPFVLMLECKTGDAVLSEDQREARDEAVAMGCVYLTVRNAGEAFEEVVKLGKGGA